VRWKAENLGFLLLSSPVERIVFIDLAMNIFSADRNSLAGYFGRGFYATPGGSW